MNLLWKLCWTVIDSSRSDIFFGMDAKRIYIEPKNINHCNASQKRMEWNRIVRSMQQSKNVDICCPKKREKKNDRAQWFRYEIFCPAHLFTAST